MTQTNIEQDIIDEYKIWSSSDFAAGFQAALKLTRERQAGGEAVYQVSLNNTYAWADTTKENYSTCDANYAKRIVFTTPQQANISDGWCLVPIEITEQMHLASVKTLIKCNGTMIFHLEFTMPC